MSAPALCCAFLVLSSCHLASPSSLEDADDAIREKPKELLRHQQNHRPLFIDRRLTLESPIQRYAAPEDREASYVASSTDSNYADPGPDEESAVVDLEDDEPDYTEEADRSKSHESAIRGIVEPETSIEKPQIRHGRSRGHFGRPLTKVEDLEATVAGSSVFVRSTGSKLPSSKSDPSGLQWVESNDTVYLDFDFEEAATNANATGNRLNGSFPGSDARPAGLTISDRKAGSSLKNRRFSQMPRDRSSSGRVTTSAGSESADGSGGRSDSFGKLRKVVAGARSRVKYRNGSLERVIGGSENSTRYDGSSGLGEYGVLVRGVQDDRGPVENRSGLERFNGYADDNDEDDDNRAEGRYDGGNSSLAREEDYDEDYSEIGSTEHGGRKPDKQSVQVDIVTRFLRIIENQHLLGENCTAGTDLNLGEGVVDQYAQERFRLEANLAVNRANMLTRLWKYAPEVMLSSEYLLHASILSMVEFDEDIFAAGNCYDKLQYRERWLYCPFAHRLQDQEGVLVKDLAVEYKYLSNSSEWFYIARKNAERVIASNSQYSRGYHTYTQNESTHSSRVEDEILTVKYEDGRWSKPYYDCGGGNIWMLTYTVPFFGYINETYFFKGTSGIDIDLRRVDIDQCPLPPESTQLNIFAASDKCKNRTTECVAIPGLGFRRGSYRCVCKRGYYYPDTKSVERYYNGTVIEEEFEKLMLGEDSQYGEDGVFECLPCAEGCEYCEDGSPCVVSLNWLMRTAILILECCIIACLPAVILFTWKFGNVKLEKELNLGGKVGKIGLPTEQPDLSKFYFVAGWGMNDKNAITYQFDLKVLDVKLADETQCRMRKSYLRGPSELCGYNDNGNTCSVVRAASPVLLRVIVLGAFFIYCTTIVMYPRPNVVTCTIRVWLREIGFSLTYGALMLKTWRISVIFRVKSAKAVKITDMNLLKRLGIIVTIFTVFLGIRTLVAPPVVIVARTADDLKAYLCRTDWWDHSFTTLEVMFLIWGIRLCIVVRKAPSEFNESRFISMAIYNEFLLSVFLNVSMLFLQSPANPDLLYIIFFCHTQLTVTLLLCLIFGSKAYVVFRGGGKEDAVGKLQGTTGKFIGKSCRTQGTSNQTNSISLQQGNFTEEADGVTEEFRRLYAQLELLKEKNMRLGNRHLVTKIQAMQEAASRSETHVSTIQAISSSLRLASEPSGSKSIEETEVGGRIETKPVGVYHHHHHRRQDSAESAMRSKGGKKKSIEYKSCASDKAEKITQLDEDDSRTGEKPPKTSSPQGDERPDEAVEDTDDKELFARSGNGEDNVNHQVAAYAGEEVGRSGGRDAAGQNSKSLSSAENDEAGESSSTRIKEGAAVSGSVGGGSGAKERGKNKSGHARTHAIVINLDDKSRFSEEVTV